MPEYRWPEMPKRRVMGKRLSRLDGPAKSSGRVKYAQDVKPAGMLYGALRKMTDKGYVVGVDAPAAFESGGGKPRFYRLTPLGRKACSAEAARLSRFVEAARDKRLLKRPR